jgi:hypothetical protein
MTPQAYRQEQIAKKVLDDFDDLPKEEQNQILSSLEDAVASVDPVALREEIQDLNKLIVQAQQLEQREIKTKLWPATIVLPRCSACRLGDRKKVMWSGRCWRWNVGSPRRRWRMLMR